MMDTMLMDEGLSFKEPEKKIYSFVCTWVREYTGGMMPIFLSTGSKKAYRNKGLRATVVKIVFGEVDYKRRIYQTARAPGVCRRHDISKATPGW